MTTAAICVCLLSLLFISADSEPIRDTHKYRVVVVGAGVAGFTAAATLLEHNVTDIVILEAADRIGGRINTVEFGGVILDKGAEFCHGQVDNAVYDLIGSYDLLVSYSSLTGAESFLIVNTTGHVFNSTFLKGLGDDAYSFFSEDEMCHFNGSVADYFYPKLGKLLQDRNADSYVSEAMHHLLPLLEGAASGSEDLEHLGAWGQCHYRDCEGDGSLKWKNGTGGYKTIFDFLSKKIPNQLEELPVINNTILGKRVVKIEERDGETRVKCADGSTYLADHVIVTVSLGVLKKHAADMFHPPLPVDKTAAIETLGFGCVAKVFMLFPNRWWPHDINVISPIFSKTELRDYINNSSYGSWSAYTYGYFPVVNHERMLCAWFSGQACRSMETLTEQQVVDGLMELLEKTVGRTYDIPQPEAILRSDWASNPLTLGSYSYRTVASDRRNLTNSDLAQPVLDNNKKPVWLFAGEATHPHYFSTVHAAIESGRREAHNIIEYMKNSL